MKAHKKRYWNSTADSYQTFAQQFSETRSRPQPGVVSVIDKIDSMSSVLDLGCGIGGVWKKLVGDGYRGRYVGMDASFEMLDTARSSQANPPSSSTARTTLKSYSELNRPTDIPHSQFIQVDLAQHSWVDLLSGEEFDHAFAFAVLHHIPGIHIRRKFLNNVKRILNTNGSFYHSEWQFLNSPRLQSRIQPWEKIGIHPDQVDPGDYLLDWRRGGVGLRYVHHFSLVELASLADDSGFNIRESFYSDGESGKLGLYQHWQPKH